MPVARRAASARRSRAATQAVATKTVNNRLSVLATMLRHAGPSGCKLIPETKLRFHVKAMSPNIVAVPIAEVGKLIASTADERYQVAVLLASEAAGLEALASLHGLAPPGLAHQGS